MMKKKKGPTNPFILTGYVSPEYFCDRDEETRKLANALANGRNVAIISPRRMGKTGLIRHVFHMAEREKTASCYYVDLYQTDSLAALVEKLGMAVMGTLDSTQQRIIKKVATFFKSLKPVVSIDHLTGEPSFSVNIQPETAEQSLAEILGYMETAATKCYVAFDEFQAVAAYADRNVEALLRAHIQHLRNVQFIFSGSQRHVLENMFASAKRPFYQSCQLIHLGNISPGAYHDFAAKKLAAHRQSISEETFTHIYNRLAGHTWYVQMLLNRLYESNEPVITSEVADSMLKTVTEENEATYQTFIRLLTGTQARLLAAVAREGTVRELQSGAFLKRHGLSAASTVKSAAKTLVEKEMLLDMGGTYAVYDRFFAIWLAAI